MPEEQQLSDVLREFARTMVTDFPIQRILDHLVGRIVDIMPITAVGVTLISPGAAPHFVAASDDAALRFERLQSELGEGPCLLAYHSGHAVAVADLHCEDRFPRFTPRALQAGLIAVFTFPLHHSDRRLGALDLYSDVPGPLSAEAMMAAQTLADVAAAYLVNAQARDELRMSSERSQEAALHDALTGLPNRVLLLERLEHAFQRDRRSGKTSAVLFADLDRFKTVNDTYGHRFGDELLVAVAQRLSAMLRPTDTLARLSGDEFVVLCEDLETPAQAALVGARLTAGLHRPFLVSGIEVRMTASLGIAFAHHGTYSADRLLHDADMAMYQAKRRGGGRLQVLDVWARQLADDEASLEEDLGGAAARGELHTEYQPIVDAKDGRITGVEALLRWVHPSLGLVPPARLIPLAEGCGLITQIGQWALGTAWTDHLRWQKGGQGDLSLSVNVSAQEFMSAGFAASVAELLASDSDAELLTFDVTENVFIRDGERALTVLDDLRQLGVKVALDDFGTGFSSMRYLQRFPIDTLKIAPIFVAGLGQNSTSHVIVDAIVQLGHGLGMTVVAEGVETADQHRQVKDLGCDSCQGYYFARPMPVASLDIVIEAGHAPVAKAGDGQPTV